MGGGSAAQFGLFPCRSYRKYARHGSRILFLGKIGASIPPDEGQAEALLLSERDSEREVLDSGHLLPHGDKLFGRGRMNADGGIKLCFGGVTFHGHGQALNNLSCLRAGHMAANHPIRF